MNVVDRMIAGYPDQYVHEASREKALNRLAALPDSVQEIIAELLRHNAFMCPDGGDFNTVRQGYVEVLEKAHAVIGPETKPDESADAGCRERLAARIRALPEFGRFPEGTDGLILFAIYGAVGSLERCLEYVDNSYRVHARKFLNLDGKEILDFIEHVRGYLIVDAPSPLHPAHWIIIDQLESPLRRLAEDPRSRERRHELVKTLAAAGKAAASLPPAGSLIYDAFTFIRFSEEALVRPPGAPAA